MYSHIWNWFSNIAVFSTTKIFECLDGQTTIYFECFPKGTRILMADDTYRKVEDLNYGDSLKVWDFDNGCLSSAPVCWITMSSLVNNHYY